MKEHRTSDAEIIEIGRIAPSVVSGVMYQVTLESGAIVTSPTGFPPDEVPPTVTSAIVTSDGRVLSVPPRPEAAIK